MPNILKQRQGGGKMSKTSQGKIDSSKIKIVHTMADGTVRESVEGYKMPYDKKTKVAYDLLVKWTLKKRNTVA